MIARLTGRETHHPAWRMGVVVHTPAPDGASGAHTIRGICAPTFDIWILVWHRAVVVVPQGACISVGAPSRGGGKFKFQYNSIRAAPSAAALGPRRPRAGWRLALPSLTVELYWYSVLDQLKHGLKLDLQKRAPYGVESRART